MMMCALQIFGETSILAAKLLDFFFHRIIRLRPTFPRSQSLANSIGSFSPPIGQQRRVQTFAAKQSTDPTLVWRQRPRPRSRCVVCTPPYRCVVWLFDNHFGIRS